MQKEQDELRAFHHSALHAVTGYNYLTRKWLPCEGPTFYAFIQTLRSHCYFNRETGETRTTCFPSLATIAQECGVSRRTICRLIQRDQDGRFVNRSLERFIKVIPRRRYDAEGHRQVQTSNLYLIAMDDPPIPEDDALVAQKEAELQAMEQIKEKRRSECQSDTLKAEPDCHSQSSVDLAQELSPLTDTPNDIFFDLHEGVKLSKQKGTPANPTKRGYEGYETNERRATKSYRIASSSGSEDQFRRSNHSSKPKMDLTEDQEAAASVIYSLLQEYGDTNAGIGAKIILKALIDAGAPDEKLIDLAYFGRARLRRFQMRGGHVENKAGYYVNLMRSLAKEARRQRWDTEQMEAIDRKRHEQAMIRSRR